MPKEIKKNEIPEPEVTEEITIFQEMVQNVAKALGIESEGGSPLPAEQQKPPEKNARKFLGFPLRRK